MDKKFKPLFKPYKIGKLEMKNRYVMEPMGTVPFDPAGYYNNDAADYYALRAKGGVGLIISGGHYGDVTLDAHELYPMPTPTQNPIMFVKFEKDIVERIHAFGTKIFIDLQFTMPFSRAEDYSTEELEFLFEQYAESALIAQRAGYDGVEILNGYINPMIQRTDRYGGDLLNRIQIDIDIMRAIKRKCGEDFPVIDRFSVSTFMKSPTSYPVPGEEYEEFGWDINKTIEAAKALEEAGFDGIHGIMGDSMSYAWSHPSMYFERGYQFKYYKQLKDAVSIPVICGGLLDLPELALKAIEDGCCDFVGVGKGLLAEPDLVNKVKTNKLDDIRPCLACHEGCLGRYVNEGTFGTCAVNPLCGREHSMPVIPAIEHKKVVVVGGGPAGLEAAYIASQRGHDVTLFEATDKLGGALLVGGAPSFKVQELKLAKWFDRQLKKQNVDIRFNCKATKEEVKALNPEVIVVAEGATPIKINIPGIDDSKVCFAEDVLSGKTSAADNCVIVGGGLVGSELALSLAKEGKKVTIVEALPDILKAGKALPMYNETPLRDNLALYNVTICASAKLAAVKEAGAVVVTADGEQTIETSQIILAVGFESRHTIADEFEDEDVEVYIAGDSIKPRNIYAAIFDGFEIGRTI